MVERPLDVRKVVGSNPTPPTKMTTKLITKKKFLDKNYFIEAAFGVLNKNFGSKSSLDYVKKIRRNWRRK